MDLTITVLCDQNFQGQDCTQCVPGFPGPDCANIDDCEEINCSGNGQLVQCVEEMDSFSCNCSSGYTGILCEINIDDCVEINCSGNGQCVDEVDSFSCNCSAGYTGTLCEININDCLSNPCGESCLLYTSPSPRDATLSRMPSSA